MRPSFFVRSILTLAVIMALNLGIKINPATAAPAAAPLTVASDIAILRVCHYITCLPPR
jgi:hypothetical protein